MCRYVVYGKEKEEKLVVIIITNDALSHTFLESVLCVLNSHAIKSVTVYVSVLFVKSESWLGALV